MLSDKLFKSTARQYEEGSWLVVTKMVMEEDHLAVLGRDIEPGRRKELLEKVAVIQNQWMRDELYGFMRNHLERAVTLIENILSERFTRVYCQEQRDDLEHLRDRLAEDIGLIERVSEKADEPNLTIEGVRNENQKHLQIMITVDDVKEIA